MSERETQVSDAISDMPQAAGADVAGVRILAAEILSPELSLHGFQPRTVEAGRWVKCVFYTQDGQKPDVYFQGFNTDRHLGRDYLTARDNMIITLDGAPTMIRRSERVWVSDAGDVFIADNNDPVNDPNRRLILDRSRYPGAPTDTSPGSSA